MLVGKPDLTGCLTSTYGENLSQKIRTISGNCDTYHTTSIDNNKLHDYNRANVSHKRDIKTMKSPASNLVGDFFEIFCFS